MTKEDVVKKRGSLSERFIPNRNQRSSQNKGDFLNLIFFIFVFTFQKLIFKKWD